MLNLNALKKQHLVFYAGLVTTVGVAVPLFVYRLLIDGSQELIKFCLALMLFVVAGAGLTAQAATAWIKNGRVDLFSPAIFFPLTFAAVYGFGSIWPGRYGVEIPASQFQFYFIGILAYFAGIFSVGPWTIWGLPLRRRRGWSAPKLRRVLAVLFVLFLLSAGFALWKTRLPLFSGTNVENFRTEFVHRITGYVYYLFRIPEIILMLFFVYLLKLKKNLFANPWRVGLIVFSLFILLSLMARRMILVPLSVGIVCYHYMGKRLTLKKIALAAVLFFALASFLGHFREQGALDLRKESVVQRFSHEINLYAALFYKTTEVFPRQQDFMGWSGFLLPFKSVLPGTQPSIGDILKYDVMEMNFRGGGFMPSILGGFYMNFGYWGIIAGMFFTGMILNFLFYTMTRRPDEFSILLYAYVSIYFLSTIQGLVLGEVWPLFVISVLLLTNLYCRSYHKRHAAEGRDVSIG